MDDSVINQEPKLGLKDVPITNNEEEALGLGTYATVLSKFIQRCDTPLTIALQGDWGSGKTSLMNLIKESLDDSQKYETIWFNTWQYAQFKMADTLTLSMMSYLVDILSQPSEGKSKVAAKTAKSLLAVARAVAIGGASVIGQADTVKAAMDEYNDSLPTESHSEDPSQVLEKLKNSLTELVGEHIKDGHEKVVMFIDDLDRLVPIRAIELLEALKVFLDIDNCVYVIACDYSVIVTGLKDKFGVSEGELKGRSFFDKIIQVPFKMPTKRYQVDTYLTNLLGRIGIDASKQKDTGIYRDLVGYSVGFNPRAMKRLLNSLQLLMLLSDEELQDADPEHTNDRARTLFGILCMQERYEPLYDHIRQKGISDETFNALKNLETEDAFESLRDALGDSNPDFDIDQVTSFLDAFYRCLQLDDDQNLSKDELDFVEQMLRMSAIVSAGSSDGFEGLQTREFVTDLRRELNTRYARQINLKRRGIKKFRYMREDESSLVYLYLPHIEDVYLSIYYDKSSLRLSIDASECGTNISLKHLAEAHIIPKMKWQAGEELRDEENDYYNFLKVEFDESESCEEFERDFEKKLIQKLDQLVPQLWQICKDAESDPLTWQQEDQEE